MVRFYYPRWPRYGDEGDAVQPHSGAGGDLNVCPRCLGPVDEDREYCEVCRSLRDEPLDLEGE